MVVAESFQHGSRIRGCFFGRQGGVSEGIFASLNCGPGSGDAREAVVRNRRIALESLANGASAKLVTLYQTHSAQSVWVSEPWDIGEGPRADAMATNVPGIALGILTADCAPVLLSDSTVGVIGAVHAGWKGALMGAIDSAIGTMERLGAQRKRIRAKIGPCIGRHNYEVGGEFRARFVDADAGNARYFEVEERSGRWRFDLQDYVAMRLAAADLDNVSRVAACTYAQEENYFSFRLATHKGQSDYGRQLSAILLAP